MAQNRYYSSLTKRTTTTLDPGASGATLTVVDTSSFAGLDSTFPYTLLVNWGLGDQEIVTATARPSGTTFTVTRGQDGTSGQSHAIGATVDHGVSARDFTDAASHQGSAGTPTTTGVHGVSGNVVGTTDTQTLSNKTIIQPTNSYTANHTATATESMIFVSAASNAVTITLPTAVGATGQTYTIQRTDSTYANSVTVATTSSQTINGATTYTALYVQYAFVQVISDGSNWKVIDASTIPEPWQAMTLQNSWTNQGGTNVTAQYRRVAFNRLEVLGLITHTSVSGSSTIATLASPYLSAHDQTFGGIAGVTNSSQPYLTLVASTGALTLNNLSSSTNIGFNGSYSLDA